MHDAEGKIAQDFIDDRDIFALHNELLFLWADIDQVHTDQSEG